MKKLRRRILTALLVLALAPTGLASAQQAAVTGTLSLSEPVAISTFSEFLIRLVDLAAPTVPVAGKGIYRGDRPLPLPFTLTPEPGTVRSGAAYALQARITINGRAFETPDPVPVDPFAATAIPLVLEPARALILRNVPWRAIELAGLPASQRSSQLRFGTGGAISASAGCLAVAGSTRSQFGQLAFVNLRHDPPGRCGAEAQRLEEALLSVLADTAAFRFADGTLLLLNAAGDTIARFAGPPI